MSPRSEEMLAEARECLAAARDAISAGHFSRSVHDSYYAMLYAARAALSERDLNAKTHGGIWHLFRETFVQSGEFDAELVSQAQDAGRLRQGADYEAEPIDSEIARELLATAERLVDRVVESLLR